MATERAWFTDPNIVIADFSTAELANKAILWAIKAILVGNIGTKTEGRWTVHGSSDGVTAGMDGTDRWGAAFDGTKLVFSGTAGAARSWIVLKSPAALGPWYLTIAYNTANSYQAEFIFSKGAPTGGSATADPTKGSAVFSWATQQFSDNTITERKTSCSKTANGDFHILSTKTGGGIAHFHLGGVLPSGVDARTDAYKFIGMCDYLDLFKFNSGQFHAGLAMKAIHTDGLTVLADLKAVIPVVNSAAHGLNHSVFDAAYYGMGGTDGSDSKYGATQILVMNNSATAAHRTIKGRLPDMYWAPRDVAEGAVTPSDTAIEYAKFGHIWLPWSGSVAPVL